MNLFYPVAAGFACCHLDCAKRYYVVVYYAFPRFSHSLGHRGFEDDPGPRLYLSLS